MMRILRAICFVVVGGLVGCTPEDPNSLAPDEVFVKYFGGEGIDKAADFVVNLQGAEVENYVIFGSSDSYLLTEQTGNTEWVLLFADKSGNLLPNGIKRFPTADFLPLLPYFSSTGKVTCTPVRIKKTVNGGYLLIGSITYRSIYENEIESSFQQSAMLIVRVDASGNYDSASDVRVFGGEYKTVEIGSSGLYDTLSLSQKGADIVEIADGYFAVGSTENVPLRDAQVQDLSDFFLVKLDADFNTVWTKTEGTASDDVGVAVVSIQNGSQVVIAGQTRGNNRNLFNATIATIPVQGPVSNESIRFTQSGTTDVNEQVVRMLKLSDTDIFLAGNRLTLSLQNSKPFLMRITSGEFQLSTQIDVPDGVEVADFYRTLGGRFVYAATTAETDEGGANGSQLLLMRTDDFGGDTNNFGEADYLGYRYGGSGNDKANAIVQLPDGKFVMLTTIEIDNNPQTVIGLMKTNKNGVLGK
ncbi:hypothetical protein [uncultured Imperialibacter sp.]|uniref:hypothetical protein n=1 Tax=uncultured Imperialibacter sp. TaxID=1672639 RepID=UPI0030DB0D06|tara:strand:- start:472 stop:1884 length:1413 start_codon:yes stop_codon:yes gene_type:complete